MKKLAIINTALLFFILNLFAFGYYFIEYPDDFEPLRYVRDAEWASFVLTLLGLIAGAVVLSFLPVKGYPRQKKILLFGAGLQALLIVWMVFEMTGSFRSNKAHFDDLVGEYRQKAGEDMRAGFIVIDYAGGLELPGGQKEQKMQGEIDSIHKTFELTYRNSGCSVYAALIKAQEEYIRLTKPFLDKRNGAGWEARMEKQIDAVRSRYW